MSEYTVQEYQDLKTAYLKLLSGTRTVQVSIGGKFIRYQETQASQVQSLLNLMAIDLGYADRRVYAKHWTRK